MIAKRIWVWLDDPLNFYLSESECGKEIYLYPAQIEFIEKAIKDFEKAQQIMSEATICVP